MAGHDGAMKLSGIVTIGLIACAVGAVMRPPDADRGKAEGAASTERAMLEMASAETARDGFARSDYLTGDYVLQRQGDGHFYAAPAINSVQIDTMVDTGASVIALTGEDAHAIGLYWNEADVKPVARGASGAVNGVNVTLERVELGGFEMYDVPAIIVPEGLGVTLLGQSFLSRIPSVEIVGEEMRFSG